MLNEAVLAARPLPVVRRSRFFLWASIVIMGAVLAGFAPTFYLRAFFDVPPISPMLYVHGVILTAWFAMGVVQACLVSVGRSDLHRRAGWIGAALAVLVVVTGALALLGSVRRSIAEAADIETVSQFAWLVFGGLVIFVGFVSTAVLRRRRADIHKRLMLLASVNIIGAAVTRVLSWPLFAEGTPFAFVRVAESNFFAVELAMIVALVMHDLLSLKRVHPATSIGFALSFLSVVIPLMIAQTEIGIAIVLAIA